MFKRKRSEGVAHVEFLVRSRDASGLASLLDQPDLKGEHARIAIDGLIEIDTDEAWGALGAFVASSTSPLVETVIQRLTDIRTPGTLTVLGDALGNPSSLIRGAAITVLSLDPSPRICPHLLRAARDPEKALAGRAARVLLRRVERRPAILGEIREATAEGIIALMDDRWSMELMSDRFPENIRILATRRLGIIGGEEASQTLASLVQRATGRFAEVCWAALEGCHAVSDFTLLPLLVDPRPEIKARVLPIYARHSDSTAADIFTGLTNDAAPAVRMAAMSALAEVAREGSIPTLEELLGDASPEVRHLAIDLLCGIEDSTPELLRVIQSQDVEVRRRALICLANRGITTEELVRPYIEFLYKGSACTDLSQREYLDSLAAVAKTLGQARNFEAMLALTALGRSVIRRLRRSAIEGLMCYPPEDRVDALYSLIDTHDPDVIKNVGMGLHEAADPRAVLPLVRTFMECRGRAMVRAREALDAYPQGNDVEFLIGCLSERWASVRRWGAERMKIVRDERAIPALLEASKDENVEVQLAVFEAMAPFAGNDPRVIERMLQAIEFGDISVRQAVCEALGEARCTEAVPHLVRALHNYFLRPRATDALKRIGDRKGYLAMKRLEIRERLFKQQKKGPEPRKKGAAAKA